MQTRTAQLSSRSLLRLSGEEVIPFLQNLITCNVEGLEAGAATFGGLLTPQGKVLFDFLVLRDGDDFLFDVRSDQREDLRKRLMFYRLRAKVDIEIDPRPISARWPATGDGFTDPRHEGLGEHIVDAGGEGGGEGDWNALRIDLGVPQLGDDFEPATVFPHEALMDQFTNAGVDFTKGCYVGQEVVSRMQHRGTARSRFVCVSAAAGSKLPAAGTPIKADERSVGTMGSSANERGLALLRLDRVAKALSNGTDLFCNEVELKPTLPQFVAFDWPDE